MPNLNFAEAFCSFTREEELLCIRRGTELWQEFCVSQVSIFAFQLTTYNYFMKEDYYV
jgi:hypothetical protein